MKHEITSKKQLDSHNYNVIIKLIPENVSEAMAIKNCEILEFSPEEKQLIDDYLNFSLDLGNYSIVKFIQQVDQSFELVVFN